MIALSFETRRRMYDSSAHDAPATLSSIAIEIECAHSSFHRRESCRYGHSVVRLPIPSTPVDSWTAADLRAVLIEVMRVGGSGYGADAEMRFTWSQESRADHRGSRGRRVSRSMAVDLDEHLMSMGIGGHRVTMKLPGVPHDALSWLLSLHSDRSLSIVCSLSPDRIRGEL